METLGTVVSVVGYVYLACQVAMLVIQTVYKCESKEFELASSKAPSRTENRKEGYVSTSLINGGRVTGSIKWIDGEYYRFVVPLQLKDLIKTGNFVSFTPVAGDERLFAKAIREIESKENTSFVYLGGVAKIGDYPPRGTIVI